MADDEVATPRIEDQLCFAVYLTGHAFSRVYRRVLADLGLTYPQYLAMLVLWERDGLTVKAMGERLILDSGTLTPLLKRLEAAGLIRRARDREDERQVRLWLTPRGMALRGPAAKIPAAMACATALDAGQGGRLLAELDRLRAALVASTAAHKAEN